MKTPLHQHFGSALFDEIDSFFRGVDAVGSIDDFEFAEIDVGRPRGLLDFRGRTHEYGLDESCLRRFDRAFQSRFFARMRHGCRNRLDSFATLQQSLVFSGSCLLLAHFYSRLTSSFAADPVSFRKRHSTIAITTPTSIG